MSAGDGFSAEIWILLSARRSPPSREGPKLITIPLTSVSAEISYIATGKSYPFLNSAAARALLTQRNHSEFFGPRDRILPSRTTWVSAQDTISTPSIHFLLG